MIVTPEEFNAEGMATTSSHSPNPPTSPALTDQEFRENLGHILADLEAAYENFGAILQDLREALQQE